jgi:CDP-paratose synthetase
LTSILISGASGFMGSALLEHFSRSKKYVVGGLVRSKASCVASHLQGNLIRFDTDNDLIAAVTGFKPDVFIHTATYFHAEHSVADIPMMIDGVQRHGNMILEALARCQKAVYFINTGTSWQHFNDSPKYRPACLHSAHKEAFEKIIEFYSGNYEITSTTLKIFDTYGCNDQRRKIVNLLVDAMLANQPIQLSSGRQLIDITHISDVARAFEAMIDWFFAGNELLSSYGVSSGKEISLRDLADQIRKIVRPDYNGLEWGVRPHRKNEVFTNWRDGMVPVPNWCPTVTIEDGISLLKKTRSGS